LPFISLKRSGAMSSEGCRVSVSQRTNMML
jgi:hypothetical protein